MSFALSVAGEGELKINNVHFKAHDLGGHEAGAAACRAAAFP
jgi:hypothetical protein